VTWSELRPGQAFITKHYVWFIYGVEKRSHDMVWIHYISIRRSTGNVQFASMDSYGRYVAFEEDPL
jgi:hypothetical protein